MIYNESKMDNEEAIGIYTTSETRKNQKLKTWIRYFWTI